jgi:hypothetical protein
LFCRCNATVSRMVTLSYAENTRSGTGSLGKGGWTCSVVREWNRVDRGAGNPEGQGDPYLGALVAGICLSSATPK